MARGPLSWAPLEKSILRPLIKRGYALTSQGRVAVTSAEHAKHIFFLLDQTYPVDSPSPISPKFPPAQSIPSDGSSAGRALGTLSGATAAAPGTTAPVDPTKPP
eukprot:6210269-Pleurochrysis_carterae.AAC.1